MHALLSFTSAVGAGSAAGAGAYVLTTRGVHPLLAVGGGAVAALAFVACFWAGVSVGQQFLGNRNAIRRHYR